MTLVNHGDDTTQTFPPNCLSFARVKFVLVSFPVRSVVKLSSDRYSLLQVFILT